MGRIQRPARADGGGLLAVDGCDCADTALALQAPETVARDTSLDHFAEDADQVFVVQSWRHGLILVSRNPHRPLPFVA